MIVSLMSMLMFSTAFADEEKIDKQKAKILYQQGVTYLKKGYYSDAAKEFEKAYDYSKDPAMLYNMGSALEKSGDIKAAYLAYEKYISQDGVEKKEQLLSHMAEICIEANLHKEAIVVLEETYKIYKEPIFLIKLAEARDAHGDKAAALIAYEDYLQMANPDEVEKLKERIEGLKKELNRKYVPPKKSKKNSKEAIPKVNILLGVGTAAGISGLVFGMLAQSERNTLFDTCVKGLCPPEAVQNIDNDRIYSTLADINWTVSLATLGAATWFMLKKPDGAPVLYLSHQGFSIRGTFK